MAGLVRADGAQACRLAARRGVGTVLLNLSLPLEIKAALALCGVRATMAPATTIWIEALAISGVLFVLLVLVGRRLGGARPRRRRRRSGRTGCWRGPGLPSPPRCARSWPRIIIAGSTARTATSALVHHRFGDALDEVAGLDGLRVHRGAWVADAAVTGAGREGRRWLLVLDDGRRIPVSARYVAAARARGWLRRRASRPAAPLPPFRPDR